MLKRANKSKALHGPQKLRKKQLAKLRVKAEKVAEKKLGPQIEIIAPIKTCFFHVATYGDFKFLTPPLCMFRTREPNQKPQNQFRHPNHFNPRMDKCKPFRFFNDAVEHAGDSNQTGRGRITAVGLSLDFRSGSNLFVVSWVGVRSCSSPCLHRRRSRRVLVVLVVGGSGSLGLWSFFVVSKTETV
ncbi:hypothetical protein QYF36_018344 [Acer negundo]|nr:hypothetical protein QYF36_018344 [Acer negundo]